MRRQLTRRGSAWSDRRNQAGKEGFKIGWRHIPKEELSANVYSGRKVDLVGVLSANHRNHRARGDELGEVVHDKAGKNFLKDVLHFFRMEGRQTNGIFEMAEGSFNAPTSSIKGFKDIRREGFWVEVGNNGFKGGVRDFEADNAEV